jgi:hypothetical protein
VGAPLCDAADVIVEEHSPSPLAAADWVAFTNQTATRLVGDPTVTVSDTAQKAYAWGDVDLDGDFDLVVARKFRIDPGKRPNVLFINENGTLTDRTEEFATDSAVDGDLGFHTPTDDSDAILVDVDLDGWLDIVTAVGQSPDDPEHIGYPRVYRNKGCAGACKGTEEWLGFRYGPTRIPSMLSASGQPGFNPCFSHVEAGDLNGDGYPELWFPDRDIPGCFQSADFNAKLLLNLGETNPGHFVDVSEATLPASFLWAQHPASGWIIDTNGDGLNDVVRQEQSAIDIAYNSPSDPFDTIASAYTGLTYYVSTGDLNNDGRLDMAVSEDGDDSYLLNVETSSDGIASFIAFTYSFSHSGSGGPASDDGFGSNNYVADLNRDGWNDVLITDVDIDVAGCDRRMHIYRNQGGSPGDHVVLEEQTTGSGCETSNGNPPSCRVATIPVNRLEGVHDVAIFDIDGDDWPDMVVGRCDTTAVYINQPPGPPAGSLDVESTPGSQLQIAKSGQDLTLSWGDSCLLDDTDYAIYVGQLGLFGVHEPFACSTGGATSHTEPPPAADAYFLVTPHNGVVEGSYGQTSSGGERPQGSPLCLPRFIAECP